MALKSKYLKENDTQIAELLLLRSQIFFWLWDIVAAEADISSVIDTYEYHYGNLDARTLSAKVSFAEIMMYMKPDYITLPYLNSLYDDHMNHYGFKNLQTQTVNRHIGSILRTIGRNHEANKHLNDVLTIRTELLPEGDATLYDIKKKGYIFE